jgi:putative hydrolase of the HAD superfamily
MIKAIFFDIGGVLVPDIFSVTDVFLAKKAGVSEKDVFNARLKHWRALKLGELDSNEFWRRLLLELGVSVSVEEMVKMAYGVLRPMPSSISLLKRLAEQKKCLLGIISNNSHEWSEYTKKDLGLGQYFDDWVSSSDVHLAKPYEGIYLLAVKRLRVKPEESVFIDNQEKNLESASAIGMNVIHFKSARQLERELKKLGVEF